MSIATRITTTDGGVLAALARLSLEGPAKRDLLDTIGVSEVENTRLRFIDQHAPDGTPWKPSIRAQSQGGQTLRDTGVLMNSITYRTSDSAVEIGTNVPYAATMHEGATIRATGGGYLKFRVGGAWAQKKEVTIEGRPFLGLSPEGEQELVTLVDAFLRTRIQ